MRKISRKEAALAVGLATAGIVAHETAKVSDHTNIVDVKEIQKNSHNDRETGQRNGTPYTIVSDMGEHSEYAPGDPSYETVEFKKRFEDAIDFAQFPNARIVEKKNDTLGVHLDLEVTLPSGKTASIGTFTYDTTNDKFNFDPDLKLNDIVHSTLGVNIRHIHVEKDYHVDYLAVLIRDLEPVLELNDANEEMWNSGREDKNEILRDSIGHFRRLLEGSVVLEDKPPE